MPQTTAWLLDLGEGLAAALGGAELLEVVADPELFAVPQTPSHCSRAMIWQGQVLPVMDLGHWLMAREVHRDRLYAGIVAYKGSGHGDDIPELAALLLAGIPLQRVVDDEAACPLPREPAVWREVSWSCFAEGERIYPVLALGHIFSCALQQRAYI